MFFQNDPIVVSIWDFIKKNILAIKGDKNEKYEIEARFGIIIDKSTSKRLMLPIRTDAVLNDDAIFTRFEPAMDHHGFENAMEFFESLTSKKFCIKEKAFTIDRIYNANGKRIRVTYDKSGTKILHCISKEKIAHIHLHLPCRKYDIRLSISREETIDCYNPSDKLKEMVIERIKDRTSFNLRKGNVIFDFTKILKSLDSDLIQNLELEAEIKDCKDISVEGIADFIDKLRIISQTI